MHTAKIKLRLEKVKYISLKQFDELMDKEADRLLDILQDIYQWAIDPEEEIDNVDLQFQKRGI